MPDKLKQIWGNIVEWWKRFDTKQKTLLASLAATVTVFLVILAVILGKPKMVELVTCEDITQANSVKELLDGAGIEYEIMEDNLTFVVNEKDETEAIYLLGTNEIATSKYSLEDVFDGSFSTTEADKTKKYTLYLEQTLASHLEAMDQIDSAVVNLSIPVDDGTILSKKEETYAAIALVLNKELGEGVAEGIAKFVATAVGNETTECITILDSKSNLLFSGGEESGKLGTLTSQLSAKNNEENRVKNQIKSVILGTGVFNNVDVGLNLVMDFTSTSTTRHEFDIADGREEGYLTSKDEYHSITTGGLAQVPGTDSNDDTSYVIDDSNLSSSEITDKSEQYALNETIINSENIGGYIDYKDSTVTVVATSYRFYYEDTLRATGALDGMTFDEFREANSDRIQLEVTDEFYNMVKTATGFDEENITVVAYEVPYFVYSTKDEKTFEDYALIAIAVLIFAMLGYVVFRSTRTEKTEELVPELSVESLLESTKKDESLEDIGFNEKSETRVLIERFVDEKPEAAAALLRNWLEEEWD